MIPVDRQPRHFQLVVHPDGEGGYHLTLEETTNSVARAVDTIAGPHLDRLRETVMTAVTSSKHPRTALAAGRLRPIALTEDAGVRLGLAALAVKPLSKPVRVEAIKEGIARMTSEEALYWYAACTGPHANRALKALRILLADE